MSSVVEHLYKIIFIGEAAVGKYILLSNFEFDGEIYVLNMSDGTNIILGKTSIVKRYVENTYSNKYKYTIGGSVVVQLSSVFVLYLRLISNNKTQLTLHSKSSSGTKTLR